ncbi:MAG: hypothetical protein ACFFCD_12310 [Promethearchaeota archaeon]
MAAESNDYLELTAKMTSLPATILKILKVNVPAALPPPINNISLNVDRVVLIVLDNFGLFEYTYYKPEFLIQACDILVMFDTPNPYTEGVLRQVFYGDEQKREFHLPSFLLENGKSVAMIGRQDELHMIAHNEYSIPSTDDMNSYIQTVKALNRYDFLSLHFVDFEKLYQQYAFQPPAETLKQLIRRTDKWLKVLYLQSKAATAFIILSSHGKHQIDLQIKGKAAQWRLASLPIAIFSKKP